MNEYKHGLELARAYESGDLRGWPGLEIARRHFNLLLDAGEANFKQLNLRTAAGPFGAVKTMLYDVCRKVLGHDTPNYPQQIGDCVSFGAKNATEYLQCCDILIRGTSEQWKPIFPPYYYGTSRVFVGGLHDHQDGSTGAWMAAAVMKFGGLFADYEGVPAYSGRVAKDWGYSGPPKEFVPVAQKHLVKSAALIRSWDDLVAAISNGYPCPTASDIGYSMEASRDGFHRQTTSWGHQMCFIGVGFNPEPYAIILNNWGDVHGHLKDFDDQSDLPAGVLRVRKADAEKHIHEGETFAYSQFDGFPEQPLDKALFKLI